MKRIAFSFAIVVLAGAALAQDTPGTPSGSTSATVIKGKAPVAKDLLKIRFPKPKSFKLKNGLEVYVLEDHREPAVRFTLQMRAGSLYESKPGVAAATAAELTEGTASMNSLQIAEQTESIGANLGANSALDTATLSVSGLSESRDTLIGLMADVLLHPTFPTDRLDRYRLSQRSGQSQRRTNPTGMIAELSSQVFYGGTKYARTPPSREEIAAIQTADLKQFHWDYYRPNGAILGVTGDVDARALKDKLEVAFADWQPAPTVAALPAADFAPKSTAHIYLIDRPNSAQSVLQFGSLGIKRTDPDYIPLVVANRVLGGGSSGRLFQNIRERKGYTYGAYSSLTAGKWPGIWGANASVRTEVTEPAVGEFFFEFKRLQNDAVPEDELTLAKRSIVGSFALTLESPQGILQRTLELVENDLPLNYWETYPGKVQAVTPADIQRVARKYLGGSNVQLLVVGERKKIEPGLAKYGTVEMIDPNKIVIAGR